jgi:hypothetical protein
LKTTRFDTRFFVLLFSFEHAHKFSGAGAVPPRRSGAQR